MTFEKAKKGRKQTSLRYRAYYRLMDACLIAGLALIAELLLPADWKGNAAYWTVGVFILPLVVIIAPLLIVGRFMRDDYAESLWRRSVAVLTSVTAILPAVFLVVTWPLYFIMEPDHSAVYYTYYKFFVIIDTENPIRNTVMMGWVAFTTLFVFIFQFLRWKDSR